jgi:geranylgeranyl pyrophosphate synthase
LAAAAECLIAATDVFDDVQDGDAPDGLEPACGLPTATNVGMFLLFLAQLAVARLAERGVAANIQAEVGRVLAAAGARACAGQQRDLDQDGRLLDEAGYLDMLSQKSGALVEGLCRAAAVLAGAEPERMHAYARFGRQLGMALQLGNDLRAVVDAASEQADVVRVKRTLPLLFALEQAPVATRQFMLAANAGGLGPADTARLRALLSESGGVLYASVVTEVCWEHAWACLEEAHCADASQLRELVVSMRGS